jgi:hypothetical protein
MLRFALAAALLSASAFAGIPNKAQEKNDIPDWTITGWETTTCCCKDICPCRFNEKPTHMECESTISIHIDNGKYGDTKLEDVNLILVSRGFDTTGNGKGWNKVYIDKRATPEQQKAIGGILMTMVQSFKPESAELVFGKEQRGVKLAEMTFKKSKDGLLREIDAPGICSVKARLAKVPGADRPVYIIGVLTEFSPIFYPAAEVIARVMAPEVTFDHPEHHRAEVEDFTLTKQDIVTKKIGFQSYTGTGACLPGLR